MVNALPDVSHDNHDRLQLLSDIASELLLSTNPSEILHRLFERLSAHLGLEFYFNYLVDDQSQRLRLISYSGIDQEQAVAIEWLDFGESLCGLVAMRRQRMVMQDVQRMDDQSVDVVRRLGMSAYVCHPLMAQGRVLGTLSFGTRTRPSFDSDELDLLHTIGDQVAMALERIRLTKELERRATELSAAVAESEASLAQFKAVISSMSEAVIITNLQGEPMVMNPAALTLFGFASLEECRGGFSLWSRVFDAHYMDGSLARPDEWPVERITRGESFSEVEVEVRRQDTGTIWIGSFSGRPVRSRSGEVMLAAITIRDITASKESERQLNEAKEVAEAANRAKDHFLAILSHELRTPLTPVLTLVQALEGDLGMPSEFLPYMEIIRRNVELEVRLIDDLLDLTRIAKGKLQFTMGDADIHTILRDVLEIYQKDFQAKRQTVRFYPDAVNTVVHGDATRLQQVFWNIVRNAVKFTGEGGQITIATCNVDSDWIRVEITDTGIGIHPDTLPTIFTAFDQGDASTPTRFGGLGLGLAISKAVVDQHRGVIRAESAGPGEGATFHVTFATTGAQDSAASVINEIADTACGVRGRVLLVAPDEQQAEMIRNVLEDERYEVRVVYGVRGAMRAAAGERFDLLLCGSVLPDGTGIDLIRNLNAIEGVRGILLADRGMDDLVRRSLDAGYRNYLVMPVEPSALRKIVERVIRES